MIHFQIFRLLIRLMACKPPINPTYSTKPTPNHPPQALRPHHRRRLRQLRRVQTGIAKAGKHTILITPKPPKLVSSILSLCHWVLPEKEIGSPDGGFLPPHHPRRPRQLRRVELEFITPGVLPLCTRISNISAREIRVNSIKARPH